MRLEILLVSICFSGRYFWSSKYVNVFWNTVNLLLLVTNFKRHVNLLLLGRNLFRLINHYNHRLRCTSSRYVQEVLLIPTSRQWLKGPFYSDKFHAHLIKVHRGERSRSTPAHQSLSSEAHSLLGQLLPAGESHRRPFLSPLSAALTTKVVQNLYCATSISLFLLPTGQKQ
jgi:hypothetical protein